MILEFDKLREALDRGGLPNQDLPASEGLVITFGKGGEKPYRDLIYDTVTGWRFYIRIDRNGQMAEIEIV